MRCNDVRTNFGILAPVFAEFPKRGVVVLVKFLPVKAVDLEPDCDQKGVEVVVLRFASDASLGGQGGQCVLFVR